MSLYTFTIVIKNILTSPVTNNHLNKQTKNEGSKNNSTEMIFFSRWKVKSGCVTTFWLTVDRGQGDRMGL
jgi:hypothetical protein